MKKYISLLSSGKDIPEDAIVKMSFAIYQKYRGYYYYPDNWFGDNEVQNSINHLYEQEAKKVIKIKKPVKERINLRSLLISLRDKGAYERGVAPIIQLAIDAIDGKILDDCNVRRRVVRYF